MEKEKRGEEEEFVNEVVSDYLKSNCYSRTLESFSRSLGTTSEKNNWIESRRAIMEMITSGRILDAIEKIKEAFPFILERPSSIETSLYCQYLSGTGSTRRPSSSRRRGSRTGLQVTPTKRSFPSLHTKTPARTHFSASTWILTDGGSCVLPWTAQ
jgi:hypothetical protein